MQVKFILFICILIGLAGCSDNDSIGNRDEFIEHNGFPKKVQVPENFTDPKWQVLGGDYMFYVEEIDFGGAKKSMLVVGNKKEKLFCSSLNINRFLILGRQGDDKHGGKFIVPYEHIQKSDYEFSTDLTEFNRMLTSVAVLKNFTWKNEMKNRILSTLLMNSQLRGLSALENEALLEDSLMPKERKIQELFKGRSQWNLRNFLRFNSETDLCIEIERSGFSDFTRPEAMNSLCLGREIFKNNEFDFKDKRNLFIYYPFVSYTKELQNKQGDYKIYYWPAVNILSFKMSFTPDGYPQFTRKNLYVSLLDRKIKKFD